jgi:hypothetical protein
MQKIASRCNRKKMGWLANARSGLKIRRYLIPWGFDSPPGTNPNPFRGRQLGRTTAAERRDFFCAQQKRRRTRSPQSCLWGLPARRRFVVSAPSSRLPDGHGPGRMSGSTELDAVSGATLEVRIRCVGAASPRLLATFEPLKNGVDAGIRTTASNHRAKVTAKNGQFHATASAADYFRNALGRDETQLYREREISNFWG